MGKRGPLPAKETTTVVSADDALPFVPPKPSKGWLTNTKRAYEAFWDTPVARVVKPGQEWVLHRHFEWIDTAKRLMQVGRAEPLVPGSQGQPVVNPALQEARNIERIVLQRFEDSFALTPKAMERLSIDTASAQKGWQDVIASAFADDDDDLPGASLMLVDGDDDE